MRMKFRIFIPLFSLLLFNCKESARTHNWFAMDSNMAVSLFGKTTFSDDSVFFRVEKETERLNQLFSDYSTRSALSQVKGHVGDTLNVDPEVYEVIKIALEVGNFSHGALDITMHDLKAMWGLGSGQTGHVPDSMAIDSIMKKNPTYKSSLDSFQFQPPVTFLENYRVILNRDETELDLGAIAKGYVVDKIHSLLDSLGCPNHIIQAGGEIRLGGKKQSGPWSVGIRHPRASDSLSGFIHSDSSKCISTSGDYERFFDQNGIRYHHIFDPRTGRPAQKICALTVVTDKSVWADAMSTSLFVLGPVRGAELARHYHAAAVWFEARPNGVCAIPMPEISSHLQLRKIPICDPQSF